MSSNEPNDGAPITPEEHDFPTPPPISPAQRNRLQKCYDHGAKLMEQDKYDFDYAHTMFAECVSKDPGNLIYVESLLDNLQRKYKNNKKGAKLAFGGKTNLKKLAGKQDWMGVIEAGLGNLKSNPWDVPTLRSIAQACEAMHLNEVELRFLKNALDAKPTDPDVNRHCARSLGRMGQYDMAIACWHRVEENKRGDREAAQAISELTLEKNRAAAGFGEAVELPASPVAKKAGNPILPEKAPASDDAANKIELTPRQVLDRAISQDPTIIENYLELAKLLASENRHGEAEAVLKKGLAASGGDVQVREALEDVQMGRARAQLAVAKRRSATEPSDEAKSLAARMEAEVLQREIEIFDARCERYPADCRLQLELGHRLGRAGKTDQALLALQLAAESEQFFAVAQLEMGICLQKRKDYQAAMAAYRAAVRSADENQPDLRKKALYRAGWLAMGLKDQETAREYLQELSQIDPDYRDVQNLIHKLGDGVGRAE